MVLLSRSWKACKGPGRNESSDIQWNPGRASTLSQSAGELWLWRTFIFHRDCQKILHRNGSKSTGRKFERMEWNWSVASTKYQSILMQPLLLHYKFLKKQQQKNHVRNQEFNWNKKHWWALGHNLKGRRPINRQQLKQDKMVSLSESLWPGYRC